MHSKLLFTAKLRDHFLHATVLKKFAFSESVYLQKKTNSSISIDAREAYQEFIFNEKPLDHAELPADKPLGAVFDDFCNEGQVWI